MDVSKLKTWEPRPERYEPRFADNRESDKPWAALYRPLIRKWQIAWLELLAEDEQGGGEDDEQRFARILATVEKATTFRNDLLAAHVVGSKGLTDDGEPITVDGLLALLRDVDELGAEVFTAIVSGGEVGEDEKGN